MRVSWPKTQVMMMLTFEQSEQGNREPVNVIGNELEIFQILREGHREEGDMETETPKAGVTRLVEWEEMLLDYCAT